MSTKITTGKVRLSYCHLFTPKAFKEDDPPKYSVTLLVPKRDKATVKKVEDAMKAARKKYIEKGKKLPPRYKNSWYDGDDLRNNGEEFPPECKGHYVITVSSHQKPVLVYPDKMDITEESELYSGCYGKAVINFFVYDAHGSKGITAGLNGIMKLADGEPLGSAGVSDSDWDDDEEEDDIDDDLDDLLS